MGSIKKTYLNSNERVDGSLESYALSKHNRHLLQLQLDVSLAYRVRASIKFKFF